MANAPAPGPRKPTLVSDVRPSTLDVRLVRSRLLFTPAMVAIYVLERDGSLTFENELSSRAGGNVNTLLRYSAGLASVRTIDFQLVAKTPLSGAEYYNRMDRATTEVMEFWLRHQSRSSAPLWFGTPVSHKFSSWQAPLAADYVVFFRVVGVDPTHGPVGQNVAVGLVAGGLIGGVIGALIAHGQSSDDAVASAAVVDLRDGRIVWFSGRTYGDVRDIMAMRSALGELVRDVLRWRAADKSRSAGADEP